MELTEGGILDLVLVSVVAFCRYVVDGWMLFAALSGNLSGRLCD